MPFGASVSTVLVVIFPVAVVGVEVGGGFPEDGCKVFGAGHTLQKGSCRCLRSG